jgi:hypothetical protein
MALPQLRAPDGAGSKPARVLPVGTVVLYNILNLEPEVCETGRSTRDTYPYELVNMKYNSKYGHQQ